MFKYVDNGGNYGICKFFFVYRSEENYTVWIISEFLFDVKKKKNEWPVLGMSNYLKREDVFDCPVSGYNNVFFF